MTQADDAIATVRENNHMGGMSGFFPLLSWAVVREALRYAWWGVPAGARQLSAPSESAFRAWTPAFQVGLGMALAGTLPVMAFEETSYRAAGGALFVLGTLVVSVAFVGAAAVERTVPPPRRVRPPAPDDPLRPHDARSGLVPLVDGVHVIQAPLVFHGLRMGCKCTVLDTGAGLVVVSPVPADDEVLEAVRALGDVRWIVAPNGLHHLFVADWHQAFPEAELWAGPGLAERRPDLPWTGSLRAPEDAPWDRQVIDVVVVTGSPMLQEAVLLHRPSGTLVLADMLMDLGQDPELLEGWTPWLLSLVRMDRTPTPPLEWKLSVTDPVALRTAIDAILLWEVERIVIAHGPVIDAEAEVILADAFAFVR